MSVDVQHLAGLARLRIGEDKLSGFEKDMERIISMVDELPDLEGEIDVLLPETAMTLRHDEIKSGFNREQMMANAPQMQAGCVVVPKTLE